MHMSVHPIYHSSICAIILPGCWHSPYTYSVKPCGIVIWEYVSEKDHVDKYTSNSTDIALIFITE